MPNALRRIVPDSGPYTIEFFDLWRPDSAQLLGHEIVAQRGNGARLYALDPERYVLVVPISEALGARR